MYCFIVFSIFDPCLKNFYRFTILIWIGIVFNLIYVHLLWEILLSNSLIYFFVLDCYAINFV